ncbi:MAG: sigma 54-interacting transcriptional regulator [Sandaracinaceae bacterium]|nr:sigma 54-interacting transcriptional regulator [Sandaracinaceae bacterium]
MSSAGSPCSSAAPSGEGHVELDDPHLSRRHAELTLSADGRTLRVVDTSSTGTEIDGRAAREGEVGDGGVLRMGDSFFVFRCDDDPHEDAAVEGMVGVAPPTRRVRSVLALVGPTPSTALLLGETGTGKELAARAIHAASGREGPLVAINCGAIPETLAEAQLFGHVSGAFTGARSAAEGLLRAANGGTVLLDEIGELPLALQPKLLRALEERTVLPVGATKFVPIDVRIVAATNKNLLDSVKAGTFRGDLYARLSDFVIELPPLRARREDILALAQLRPRAGGRADREARGDPADLSVALQRPRAPQGARVDADPRAGP